ncbi:MAG: ComF family protein [Lachnospiraceae bacterium]|nr:ComF family protein [Lachnospiraceae bacterium]
MAWMDEWLFPRRCPVCLDIVTPRGAWICDTCRGGLSPVVQPSCFRCGRQLIHTEEEYCSRCQKTGRSFDGGIAGWNYSSVPVRRLISEVKYHNHRQLLDYPCREMALAYGKKVKGWGIECLVPIPLHPSKKRRRGFNQAEEIAVRLADVWGIPIERRMLRRVRRTLPQKELGEAARLQNLLDAFDADLQIACRYRCVGLTDDILTTGSTMEACTRVLKAAGVRQVFCISLSATAGR